MAAEAEHAHRDEGVGDLKPKAMRVMSRIEVVLTDSVRPLDKPCSIAARIDGVCATMLFLQFHECRDPASAGPADPAVQRLAGLLDGQLEDQPETLFELVAAVQPGVGPGDPVEFDALFVGEVLRIFPQHVTHTFQSAGTRTGRPRRGIGRRPARCTSGLGLPGQSAGVVPGLTAHLVQGVGGPAHHVERIIPTSG